MDERIARVREGSRTAEFNAAFATARGELIRLLTAVHKERSARVEDFARCLQEATDLLSEAGRTGKVWLTALRMNRDDCQELEVTDVHG